MMIRTRLAMLESKGMAAGLAVGVRAWLGQTHSPAEQRQAAIEAARPLPPTHWSSMSKEAQEWLQA